MTKRFLATVLAVVVLTASAGIFGFSAAQLGAVSAQAQQTESAPEADARAGTGGAQTLEDILRRQRGEDVSADRPPIPDPPDAAALGVRGAASDSDLWRAIRHGETFQTSARGTAAGIMIQDEGESWQETRDGPLRDYSLYAMLGMIALLVLFFVLRGRIRIDAGRSATRIERFRFLERFGHWTLAVSFILLALTGLNLLYGRAAIDAIYGVEASPERADALRVFADVTLWGKWIHNNVAWPFMLSLVLVFVLWVAHNLPSWNDVKWLAKGGGLFSKGSHPPARKFNAGQKIVFWSVILMGGSVSASGLSLLFPYEMPMFAATFAKLNEIGAWAGVPLGLETALTPIQEMQYAQLWHTIVAVAMIVIVLAHIYIGSVGMEGAFDAMGSGEVDLNWAREHHSLWVEEMREKGELHPHAEGASRPAAAPAE